jgi:D-alanyl-D-alanine carboxypeptidase
MKKALIILILFFVFSLTGTKTALASNNRLFQQIEILRHEISLLQMLLANMNLRQEIVSPSYIAVDLSTDSILLEKNSNIRYPIASITKLMTSVIALEKINKDQKIILDKEMLEPFGHSPTLFLGASVTAENLVKANLIQSTNDASQALAVFLGRNNHLNLMNQKAKEIGMNNTFFYDAHGLSSTNRSTASDLVKLLSYIHKNHPEILSITRDNNFWLPDSSGSLLKFQNVNNFYYLGSFVGGKTGYLPEARQTIASIFNVNQKATAIVVLYSTNRQADVFSIIRRIK